MVYTNEITYVLVHSLIVSTKSLKWDIELKMPVLLFILNFAIFIFVVAFIKIIRDGTLFTNKYIQI